MTNTISIHNDKKVLIYQLKINDDVDIKDLIREIENRHECSCFKPINL